MSYKHTDMLA